MGLVGFDCLELKVHAGFENVIDHIDRSLTSRKGGKVDFPYNHMDFGFEISGKHVVTLDCLDSSELKQH